MYAIKSTSDAVPMLEVYANRGKFLCQQCFTTYNIVHYAKKYAVSACSRVQLG